MYIVGWESFWDGYKLCEKSLAAVLHSYFECRMSRKLQAKEYYNNFWNQTKPKLHGLLYNCRDPIRRGKQTAPLIAVLLKEIAFLRQRKLTICPNVEYPRIAASPGHTQ